MDGVHRQSVQLCDLDGDGEEEAVAFFATAGEKPLKIYIFRRSAGKYEKAAVIEGVGSSIESIDYEDLDGDGWMEAVVGWGMGGDLKMLELYTLKGYQAASIAAADYSRYLTDDMNGDGRKELVAVRRGSAEAAGSVTLYDGAGDGGTPHRHRTALRGTGRHHQAGRGRPEGQARRPLCGGQLSGRAGDGYPHL